MSGLNNWEVEINLDTLYRVGRKGADYEVYQPAITVEGIGSIDIHCLQNLPSTPPSDMVTAETNVSNYNSFSTIPNYIYVTENEPGTKKIILSGFEVEEIT